MDQSQAVTVLNLYSEMDFIFYLLVKQKDYAVQFLCFFVTNFTNLSRFPLFFLLVKQTDQAELTPEFFVNNFKNYIWFYRLLLLILFLNFLIQLQQMDYHVLFDWLLLLVLVIEAQVIDYLQSNYNFPRQVYSHLCLVVLKLHCFTQL